MTTKEQVYISIVSNALDVNVTNLLFSQLTISEWYFVQIKHCMYVPSISTSFNVRKHFVFKLIKKNIIAERTINQVI